MPENLTMFKPPTFETYTNRIARDENGKALPNEPPIRHKQVWASAGGNFFLRDDEDNNAWHLFDKHVPQEVVQGFEALALKERARVAEGGALVRLPGLSEVINDDGNAEDFDGRNGGREHLPDSHGDQGENRGVQTGA